MDTYIDRSHRTEDTRTLIHTIRSKLYFKYMNIKIYRRIELNM